jgi:hypothetical protein
MISTTDVLRLQKRNSLLRFFVVFGALVVGWILGFYLFAQELYLWMTPLQSQTLQWKFESGVIAVFLLLVIPVSFAWASYRFMESKEWPPRN